MCQVQGRCSLDSKICYIRINWPTLDNQLGLQIDSVKTQKEEFNCTFECPTFGKNTMCCYEVLYDEHVKKQYLDRLRIYK